MTTTGAEKITLGGGCFWCVEAVFDELKGVTDVVSGYSGGAKPNPTYKQVCSGNTGHAEVIQVSYDPAVLGTRQVLEAYFAAHDPTTLNRQGADSGTQYRSVIFYHTPEQKQVAVQLIRELTEAKVWKNPIVTELSPFKAFYPAEDYHQEYFKLNGSQPYCRIVIEPKMSKFRKQYHDRLKV
jgi:peptide-methionine (S)-S-oxide reductase